MQELMLRIRTGWNAVRVIYLALGIFIIVQSALRPDWVGVIAGGWFAAMGLFALGCAGGNCAGGNCDTGR